MCTQLFQSSTPHTDNNRFRLLSSYLHRLGKQMTHGFQNQVSSTFCEGLFYYRNDNNKKTLTSDLNETLDIQNENVLLTEQMRQTSENNLNFKIIKKNSIRINNS